MDPMNCKNIPNFNISLGFLSNQGPEDKHTMDLDSPKKDCIKTRLEAGTNNNFANIGNNIPIPRLVT